MSGSETEIADPVVARGVPAPLMKLRDGKAQKATRARLIIESHALRMDRLRKARRELQRLEREAARSRRSAKRLKVALGAVVRKIADLEVGVVWGG